MVLVEDSPPSRRDSGLDPDVFGAAMEDIDMDNLGEETQRFVLETHIENLGLFDFLGFELASLAAQYSDYSRVPDVAGAGPRSVDKLGDAATFVTLVKSFMGIGVLTMPYAVLQGGYFAGPVGLVIICVLEWYCIELLIKTSQTSGSNTLSFGALGRHICGKWAKALVNASLILTQFGVCIAYVIFISDNVADVVCHETRGVACPAREAITVGLLIWVLPFCLLRSLNMLAVPMLMSNVAILGVISWCFYCGFSQMDKEGPALKIVAVNWEGLPIFFGCVVFAFEGIGLIMPIQAVMAEPTHLPRLLRFGMLFLGTLYAIFGTVCYMAFGLGTQAMVTFNIPAGKISSFLRLFYCFAISFSYPVMIFPVFQLLEGRYRKLKKSSAPRGLVRAAIVAITGIIGLNIPNFGLFLGLVGSMACSSLAFIFPALFHLKGCHQGVISYREKVVDIAMIAFGGIAGSLSFVLTLKELIEVVTSDEPVKAGGGGHR